MQSKSYFLPLLGGLLLAALAFSSRAESGDSGTPAPVYLGFDGAYGLLHSTSPRSIERGIKIALAEINAAGGVLNGRPLELKTRDNRSVPARGIANLKAFAEEPDLVAVVGGRFSPVILEQLPIAHELNMILLDAWGSADGITQHDYTPSYSFRLSLYDSLGMPVMLRHAAEQGAEVVGLLVPNTGWGRSNAKAARAYESKAGQPKLLKPVWYLWGEKDMLRHYRKLREAGAQSIILVANDIEGSQLVRQLAEIPESERLPIVSHWGVTGGEFVEKCGPILFDLDFSVVQTFSFFNSQGPVHDRVLALAERLFGLKRIEEIDAPVGLAHAYDLTHILARAIEMAGSTDRTAIRDALEQVKDYQGLTGYYARPFTPDDHDALKAEQVFMTRYRPEDGAIVPLSFKPADQD